MDEALEWLKSIPPDEFMEFIQISLWIVESCKKFNLEISYIDDEIIQFKRKK